LAEFVANELVSARQGTDGRIHFRVNPKKQQEIQKRLNL
jgi:hypothetical protein